ncbi:MAG TPA: WecB/TagA/CpsF family glycosyltransferase [Mycobacteriales bacterium]|nr:WecB/TagA/CpsF family glycosyltransferase [Mycobacteriales bacterium]
MEPETLLATIDQLILSDRVSFVANHNLHSAHIVQNDPAMREFVDNADVTLIDGFPIYLLARMAPEGVDIDWRTRMRVGTLDWVSKVQTLRHLRRLAVIGSTAESNAGAVTHFRGLLPDVEILGVPGADWDARSASEAVEKLAEFRPNLVLVGLGMPRQEGFLQQYAAQLPPAVYATVGGAIDQLSGHQRGAPRILGQYGLEWLWRLVAEPRRLAYRYLIEPWFLVRPIVGRGLPRMRSDISGSAHG